MDNVDFWIRELGYDTIPGGVIRRTVGFDKDQAFSSEIRGMFNVSDGLSAAAFACVDGVPTIALVSRVTLPSTTKAYRATIRDFCERLWNQNLARVVIVAYADSFEAWSVDNPKANREQVLVAELEKVATWSLTGILGGKVLEGHSSWFDPERRVDKKLLESIFDLVQIIGIDSRLTPATARELIARVIFVSYLEDRGIISDDYRKKNEVKALHTLIGSGDAQGINRLFLRLQEDFHGDFLRPLDSELTFWPDISSASYRALDDFLSRTVLRSGQKDFWRYDFSEIPIELIAGIYETFLIAQDGSLEHSGELITGQITSPSERLKRKQGAYYTPRVLANTVVAIALEGLQLEDQKVFDGACGSGMLLTAVFQRLIYNLRISAETKNLGEEAYGFQARCDALLSQVFGADIDEDACRLTSFSLYLVLLSDLNPRDLAVLRDGGHKLPSLANNIRRGNTHGDFFSLTSELYNRDRYTVIISNPPWRRLRDGDVAVTSVTGWIDRQCEHPPHVPSREIAAAYTLATANCVKAGSRVALILPVNLFISVERTRRDFRGDLIGRFSIDKVINFSDMRYLLFSDARHPFVVLIASARDSKWTPKNLSSETFQYITPKADISLAFDRLTIHGSDSVSLPISSLIDTTPHLALRYWGDQQDYQLLSRLRFYGRVGDLINRHGWISGKGFHREDNDRRRKESLRSIEAPEDFQKGLFLDAKHLPRDLPVVTHSALQAFPYKRIARAPIEERLFSGPRVLWPDGTNPAKGVNAVYTNMHFTFQHSIGVLSAPDTEIGCLTARFLTCYMRSSLGSWLSILLSASVSAERAKLHQAELLDWPFWCLDNHPQPEIALQVMKRVDALLRVIESSPSLIAPRNYQELHQELDALVFEYFCIAPELQNLVKELANFIGPCIQPAGLGYKSLVKPLRQAPDRLMIKKYISRLTTDFQSWQDTTKGQGEVRTTVWTANRAPIGAAILTLVVEGDQSESSRIADDTIIQEISASLVRVAGQAKDTLFRIPNLTLLDGNRIIIIKPLIGRYWLERSASADAARVATDLQALSQPSRDIPSSSSEIEISSKRSNL